MRFIIKSFKQQYRGKVKQVHYFSIHYGCNGEAKNIIKLLKSPDIQSLI